MRLLRTVRNPHFTAEAKARRARALATKRTELLASAPDSVAGSADEARHELALYFDSLARETLIQQF